MSEKYQARDAAFSIVYKDPQEILKEARAQLVLDPKRSWTKGRLFYWAWNSVLICIVPVILLNRSRFPNENSALFFFLSAAVMSMISATCLVLDSEHYRDLKQREEKAHARCLQLVTLESAMKDFYGKQLSDARERLLGTGSPMLKMQQELEQKRSEMESERERVRIRLRDAEKSRRLVLLQAEELCSRHLEVVQKTQAAHSLVMSKAQALLSELEDELERYVSQVSQEMGDEELLRRIEGLVQQGEGLIQRSETERMQFVRHLGETLAEVQATLSGLELQKNRTGAGALESHERFIERAEYVAKKLVRMSG